MYVHSLFHWWHVKVVRSFNKKLPYKKRSDITIASSIVLYLYLYSMHINKPIDRAQCDMLSLFILYNNHS